MKKILLANFSECPENLHFERALARAAARRALCLDVVHDFDCSYAFIGAAPAAAGKKFKYSGLADLKLTARGYDALLLLDFAKRARSGPAYLWLAVEAEIPRKIFIANHLLPMPGHNFTADLARRVKALSAFEAGYMLSFDDKHKWPGLGLAGARLLGRGYTCDCEYYKPQKTAPGGYVFSAGSAGRDFAALALGAEKAGLPLKIFSDEKPAPGLNWLPLSKNLHNLRAAAAGALAVVIPLNDRHINQAAGNSIAFLAMALGRPVLTRRTSYMESFIEDGVNGFLYTSLSPGSVAEGLGRIKALTPAGMRKLGAAARKTMLADASLGKFCSGLLENLFKSG